MNYDQIDLTKIIFTYMNNFIKISYENPDKKLIIKSPQLKIGYNAKKFEIDNKINYTYTVKLQEHNNDFIEFINNCEDLIIDKINEYKKQRNNKIKYKYNSSIQEGINNELFLKIKLITDKNNNIITKINNINGKVETYETINNNYYINQYIELSNIFITGAGQIYTTWYAHQIVLNPIETVFSDKSLLYELNPNIKTPLAPVFDFVNENAGAVAAKINKPPIISKPTLQLNPSMLLDMKSKLKKA